jgi:Zn-dependent protease
MPDMFGRGGSLTLFRIRSIPVRAHWTLLAILPYLAIVFSARFGAAANQAGVDPASVRLPPMAWGFLVAIGVFASVVVHELAHALVAIRFGGRVREITLMMLGGISQIERLPSRPRAEALMAAAGPATSLLLGGALLGSERLFGSPDLRVGLYYLSGINFVLAAFNILPAFPMDGGRVLRALLTGRLGRVRATEISAAIGKVGAIAFGVWGALQGSVMLVLIALFLYTGAQMEAETTHLHDVLGHRTLGDLMATPAPVISLDATLAEAVAQMRRSARLDLVVVGERGQPAGVLRPEHLSAVDEPGRAGLRIADLGDRIAAPVALGYVDENARTALERAARAGANYLLVLQPSGVNAMRAAGVVGPTELAQAMALEGTSRRGRRGYWLRPA